MLCTPPKCLGNAEVHARVGQICTRTSNLCASAGSQEGQATSQAQPVPLSRAVAPPKAANQPHSWALDAWQSLATISLRLLSACLSAHSKDLLGKEAAAAPAHMVQLVGKLTGVEQHKAAARTACLCINPCTSYNKAQAAMKGTVASALTRTPASGNRQVLFRWT